MQRRPENPAGSHRQSLKFDDFGFSSALLKSFRATSSRLWAVLEPLGGLLGARSSGSFGPFWSRLGGLLGHLEVPWAGLGASWAALGPSWGPLGAVLGMSWAHVGHSWGNLGSLGHLEPLWGPFWAVWCQSGYPLGGCELRTRRHFRGLVGAPAEWCHTQNIVRPRRPWGLRIAKLSPLSGAPGRPSGMTLYADQNVASPPLGAANSETVATFGGS